MATLEQIFVPGFNQSVTMPSRKRLQCSVEPDYIAIYGTKKEGHMFQIFRDGVGAPTDLLPGVWFWAHNKGNVSGQRPPDIFAAKLLERSVRFFETYGPPVQRLQASWNTSPGVSDNFAQYQKYLEQFGPNPTVEQEYEAARQTWTGQCATAMGFTALSGHYSASSFIQVDFERPEPPAQY